MRADTYRALDAYKDRFGEKWPGDLTTIKNSQEWQLVDDIKRAIQNAPKVKKKVKNERLG